MPAVLGGIGVVVVVIVLWYIVTMNGFRQMEVKIKEAESGIDVALTKRFDVLTKMLDVAKKYLAQEKEVILKTIELRSSMSMAERQSAIGEMTTTYKNLMAVAENYPQLTSSEQFKQLQLAIADTEEHLQAARRAYNANVSSYNQKCVSFPASIVAGAIGATQKSFFEADSEKRSDVKMDF